MHQDIEVRVVDAANRKVEFIDTLSGTSLATRILDSDGRTTARGFETSLRGLIMDNDLFHIADNGKGIGDASR